MCALEYLLNYMLGLANVTSFLNWVASFQYVTDLTEEYAYINVVL